MPITPLQPWSGGSRAFREKLNQSVDRLNMLSASLGGNDLDVVMAPGGVISRVAVDRLQPRIPRTLGVAGFFPVKVKKISGNTGDLTSACTFVYDLWAVTSNDPLVPEERLAQLLTPKQLRTAVGRYEWVTEPGKTWGFGTAFYADGEVLLATVYGERPDTGEC